ncbi:redoxin family protein [Anaerophaga thermohalophila]|uniref:redoxin family protein n=1 Tax=Anaerophaga thermohalophila TaxID=177400 RepID=UPI000237CDA6|nr:redoxin family protein [Anaerophaga thermohalophila]
MKRYSISFILIGLMACLVSCQTNKQSENNRTGNLFVPHPQYVEKQEVKTLKIGMEAPDFTLPDMNGNQVSLKDFSDAKVLVVVFTCLHCPTAQAYEDRLIRYTAEYKDRGVQVVAIMPNSNLALLPEECGYSDLDDSYENMRIRAADKHFNFPFLYDGDNEAVSLNYGPTTTPHVFVFDRERKLRYVGNLDQHEKPGTGNAENLRAATDAVLAGKTVENPVTKSFGCSIKWGWKQDLAQRADKIWEEKPVNLSDLDLAGIRKLVENDSKKLRLINVWATWCAPCVIEYPDLVKIQRMYGQRDFEFISLSVDKMENREKVQEFLQNAHSAIQNYIYSEGDHYKLIEAIDPEWNGALPYSMLIEPGGKVVWKCQGAVDPAELKKTIVDHPMIGRYY